MQVFTLWNGANAQAAFQPKVATGTGIKTMLQLKTTRLIWIIEWGFFLDSAVAETPGSVELIDTNTVPATSLTAAVDNDFTKEDPNSGEADDLGVTYGTGNTGYTAGAEGTVNARTRVIDAPIWSSASGYSKEWALGRYPMMLAANYLRIRAHFGVDRNMRCFIKFGI
jgi:hypothetical protein